METKLKDIKIGEFFTIDGTTSYPKLRTDYGYIDFRDEIKKECNDLPFKTRKMSDEEVIEEVKKYNINTQEKLDEERENLLKN